MTKLKIKWKKLNPAAEIPAYATAGAACFDMKCVETVTLKKGEVATLSTGLAAEVPFGYELQLRARSGLALKHGLTLVNGVGTIDSDYRGEIKVIVTLLGQNELTIQKGDRVCQGLVAPVLQVEHECVSELSETDRGAGGFGSTGVSSKAGAHL